jgi:hypothetical protein
MPPGLRSGPADWRPVRARRWQGGENVVKVLHFLIDVLVKLLFLTVCVNLLFHFLRGQELSWQGLLEWEELPDRLLFVGRALLTWVRIVVQHT